MLDNLEGTMKKVTGKKDPLKNSLVGGDTGYFSEDNLQEAAKRRIKGINTAGQARGLKSGTQRLTALSAARRGVLNPFLTSLVRSCPSKLGRDPHFARQ